MSIILKQLPPEPGVKMMGLENHGLSMFPGVKSAYEIPVINGRFNIGLDNPKYEDRIKDFEKHLNFEFNSEQGQRWLDEYTIELSHDSQALDPKSRFEDRFALHVLEVNKGFGVVALNPQMIEDEPTNNFKFTLTDENYESDKRIGRKEIKMRANKLLSELYDGKTNRIILLAKYLLSITSGVGKDKGAALDKLTDFIDQSQGNVERFLSAAKLDPEYISTVVKVKEAISKSIITVGQDGMYIIRMSGDKLGRTESEAIEFLTLPKNKHLMGEGLKDDLPYSISTQLKDMG